MFKKFISILTITTALIVATNISAPKAKAATIYVDDIKWYGSSICGTFDNLCGSGVGTVDLVQDPSACTVTPLNYVWAEFQGILAWILNILGGTIDTSCY